MERTIKLAGFLHNDLGVEAEIVAIGLRRANTSVDPLHLVLWQLGLISLGQVQQTLVWLETQPIR